VRDLQERGEVVRDPDGTWTKTGFLQDIRVPASVRELIEHRLRRLDPEEQDLLEIAACCGFSFDPSVVAEAAGEALVPTLKRFRGIERNHRLIRAEGRRYEFDHHQVQEALYEMLFVQLREQYHAAIGAVLEARADQPAGDEIVRLCHHHLLGGNTAHAVPHLASALDYLGAQHQHQRSLELCNRALESDALEPALKARVHLYRCRSARALGDAETDAESGDVAIAIADEIGDKSLGARARITRANLHMFAGDLSQAQACFEEAREVAIAAGDRATVQAVHRGLGIIAQKRGAMEESESHYREALAIAEETDDAEATAGAHINLGSTIPYRGAVEEAKRHLELGIEIATEIGALLNVGHAHSNLGRLLHGRGDLAGALFHARKFREVMRTLGDRRGEVTAAIVMCALWRPFGALDEMRRDLDYARKWGERTGDRWMESYAHVGLGWIAEQGGDLDEAVRATQTALELSKAIGAAEEIADAYTALGSLAMKAGDQDTARAHYREAAGRAKDPQGAAKVNSRAGLAVLGDGDPDAAARAIEAAGDVLSISSRIEAYALLSRIDGGAPYLAEAKRWLNVLLDQIPPEYRDSSRKNVALHRKLLATDS